MKLVLASSNAGKLAELRDLLGDGFELHAQSEFGVDDAEETGLSFIEFNYMLLQSYDFVELARRYGCNLQMGGSDQWGNIVTGIDLGRRMGTPQLYALTAPLLTTCRWARDWCCPNGTGGWAGTGRPIARCRPGWRALASPSCPALRWAPRRAA